MPRGAPPARSRDAGGGGVGGGSGGGDGSLVGFDSWSAGAAAGANQPLTGAGAGDSSWADMGEVSQPHMRSEIRFCTRGGDATHSTRTVAFPFDMKCSWMELPLFLKRTPIEGVARLATTCRCCHRALGATVKRMEIAITCGQKIWIELMRAKKFLDFSNSQKMPVAQKRSLLRALLDAGVTS